MTNEADEIATLRNNAVEGVYRAPSPRVFTIDEHLLQRINDILHVIGAAPPGAWSLIEDLRQDVGRMIGDPPHPWCYKCQAFHEGKCLTEALQSP